MSNRGSRIVALVAVLLLAIAGVWVWDSGQHSAPPSQPAGSPPQLVSEQAATTTDKHTDKRERAGVEAAETLSIPAQYQFAGVYEVATANSFDELMALYSIEQRERIEAFVGDYDKAAYLFSSPEELAWMAQRGFPMPDDILAANDMSVGELKKQAEEGNVKAAFFYLRREAEDGPVDRSTNEPELRTEIRRTALLGDSPFYGYLHANELATQYPEYPTVFASGLAWASMMGDARAGARLRGVMVDAAGLVSGLEAVKGDRRMGLLLRGRSAELPDFEHYPMGEESFDTFDQLIVVSPANHTR